MKKHRIRDFFPPGYNYELEIGAFTILLFLFFAHGLSGFNLAIDNLRLWYEIEGPAIKVHDINVYTAGELRLFVTCVEFAVLLAIFKYRYFKTKTKSIYLMKRLPDRKELHVRCLAGSVVGIVAAVLIAALLLVVFRSTYLNLPKRFPGISMPEYRGINIWRTLL